MTLLASDHPRAEQLLIISSYEKAYQCLNGGQDSKFISIVAANVSLHPCILSWSDVAFYKLSIHINVRDACYTRPLVA